MGPDAVNGVCGLGTISRDTHTWTLEVSISDHVGSGLGLGLSLWLDEGTEAEDVALGVGQELTQARKGKTCHFSITEHYFINGFKYGQITTLMKNSINNYMSKCLKVKYSSWLKLKSSHWQNRSAALCWGLCGTAFKSISRAFKDDIKPIHRT